VTNWKPNTHNEFKFNTFKQIYQFKQTNLTPLSYRSDPDCHRDRFETEHLSLQYSPIDPVNTGYQVNTGNSVLFKHDLITNVSDPV